MPMPSAKAFALGFAVLYVAAAWQPAFARDDYGIRDIMVEEGGKPLKKNKGIEPNKGVEPNKRGEPKVRPRGSGYVPNTSLPRTVAPTVAPATPGVYQPPPINSYSDRVIGCNHSFPLNAGIGNNPTERGAYVRQCAN